MRRLIYYVITLLQGGVLYSARVAAQQPDSSWWNTDYITHSNAWINSSNVAGLKYLAVSKISTAEVYSNVSKGKFINFYQSDNSYTLGATTSSLYRLNSRVVFQGCISYDYFSGRNMGGSAFIDPYKNPLDIDENADTTKGTKKLEHYELNGAVSVKLNSRLTLGGKMNYEAGNYAKTKDLRHVNKLLNMHVAAGAMYALNNKWEIGFAYRYIRRIESVKFTMNGKVDRHYLSLINFGSFYGLAETFGDDGYTSQVTPMVNNTHELSLQLNTQLQPGVQLLHEFTYGMRNGYFGNKGVAAIVYTAHKSKQYQYHGALSMKAANSLHNVDWNAGYEILSNGKNEFRRETTSAGNSSIVYYGQTKVLDQTLYHGGLEYTAYLHPDNNNPLWVLKAGGNYNSREQTVNRYPFYRKQLLNSYDVHVAAGRNIVRGNRKYNLLLDAAYGSGSGTAKEDGIYATTSSSPPASRDIYLYQEFEYTTSPRIILSPSFQYEFKTAQQLRPFLSVRYTYTKAFNVNYVGADLNNLRIAIGCNF